MSDKNKKVLVICPAPIGVSPGQRLKYEQYFEYFKDNDYQITVSNFMTDQFWKIVYKKGNLFKKIFWTCVGYSKRVFDLFRIWKYDCVYIFLWVTPFGSTFFERAIIFLARRVIYDIDDLVFLKPASTANPIVRLFKSSEKPIYLMKKADHVITCTPYLNDFAKQYNKNTTDISSTINTDLYRPVNTYSNDKIVTLGWTGSFSTSEYLYLIESVLERVYAIQAFKLIVIGDTSVKFKNIECETIEWSANTEVRDLQRIDIGLYPLPEDDWVKGKSGLKALMYMALGIPTVATAIGTIFRIIENGISGFLVENEQQWVNRILELMNNPDLRKSMGGKSIDVVEKNYSINANKDTYLSILNNTISNDSK